MLLALLVLIADFLALEGPELFKGFSGLHLLGQLNWIVLDIAWNPALVLAAFAFLLYLLLAGLTRASVAFHPALVKAAWQELLAGVVAYWYWISARSPLPPNQRLDGVVATRTVPEPLWISWAGLAVAIVAPTLACVLSAIEQLPADVGAPLPLASTCCLLLLLATEAIESDFDRARLADAVVAGALALVTQAVEELAAGALACELGALGKLAWDSLLLFSTVAGHGHVDAAGWAASRMAKDVAAAVCASLVLLLVTVLATRVRQYHVVWRWLLESPAEALVAGQVVLSIAVVAVWASPRVECKHQFRISSSFPLHTIIGCLLDLVVGHLLFLEVLCSSVSSILGIAVLVGILVGVQLLDPSLDAAEMEWLAALLAVPDGTALINWVRADDAFLRTSGQRFYKSLALLSQVIVVAQEVEWVVAHARFVLHVLSTMLQDCELLWKLAWMLGSVLEGAQSAGGSLNERLLHLIPIATCSSTRRSCCRLALVPSSIRAGLRPCSRIEVWLRSRAAEVGTFVWYSLIVVIVLAVTAWSIATRSVMVVSTALLATVASTIASATLTWPSGLGSTSSSSWMTFTASRASSAATAASSSPRSLATSASSASWTISLSPLIFFKG